MAFDANALDEIIHGRARLGIVAYLSTAGEADFTNLRDRLQLTDGNLSTHLRKLEEAGYVRLKKRFVARKPQTTVALTDAGRAAYLGYLEQLQRLISESSPPPA